MAASGSDRLAAESLGKWGTRPPNGTTTDTAAACRGREARATLGT